MGEYSWGSTAGGGAAAGGIGTPVNFQISSTNSYTVPLGKVLIAHASAISQVSVVAVNGVQIVAVTGAEYPGPIGAKAGDVLTGLPGPLGISGMLYDA